MTALYRALVVLTEDPRHVEWLKETDPNALKQALLARKAYLVNELHAMVKPLGNGPGLSMGNSRTRMSIGGEIEELDARLIEPEHVVADEADASAGDKFHIKKHPSDTTGYPWHYWHDRDDRDYGSTAEYADAVASVVHAMKTGD